MTTYLPKPTEYRGITYRSRTEARWSVLLDNHPEVIAFQYEPFTVSNPRTYYQYLPDFLYLTKGGKLGLLEVKPSSPTPEYLMSLHQLSFWLPKTINDFVVGVCSWFDGERIRFHDVFLQGEPSNHFLDRYDSPITSAKHYRFDLIQWLGPSPKQSVPAIKLLSQCLKGDGEEKLTRSIKKWLEQQ
jgi:hypothetical protein